MTGEDMLHPNHLNAEKIVPHLFAGKNVPFWLALVYLSSNSILNLLNYYWFTRMIQTVASRFSGDKGEKVKAEKVTVDGEDLKVASGTEKTHLKKRKA